MAALIAINGAKKPGILKRAAKLFPFRGRKRVTPHLNRNREIFVARDGILSGGRVNRTRIYAAQLAALGIEQISIAENTSARSLLDRIAREKAIPQSEAVTVADISTPEGQVAYVLHPLSNPFESTMIFNKADKGVRETIFNELSSEKRVRYVTGSFITYKLDLIALLTREEVTSAAEQMVKKLDNTWQSYGRDYITILKWLGEDKNPKVAERIRAFEQRREEIKERQRALAEAQAKQRSKGPEDDNNDDGPPEDGGTPPYLAGIPGTFK